MKNNSHLPSRRTFLKTSGCLAGAVWSGSLFAGLETVDLAASKEVPVSGHLWVYASKYPPDWDCTPIMEQVFSDFAYAGMNGVELMEINLRHPDAVSRMGDLIKKYSVPVTGTSYNGDMWQREKQQQILEDVELVVERLHALGGSTFGISVGDAKRKKTDQELDAQADLLKKIREVCRKNRVEANLHNHTYEVRDEMHDLKGTLARIPDFTLGPDLNWLIRGGVDPVTFIQTYGRQIGYLHLRDQKADGKWTEALGEGATNFQAIAHALKKANFQGRAAVELAFDSTPLNPVKEDWKKSRDYVKKIFGW